MFLCKYKNTNIETAYKNTIFVHQQKKKKRKNNGPFFLYHYSRFPAVQIVLNTTHVQKYINLKIYNGIVSLTDENYLRLNQHRDKILKSLMRKVHVEIQRQ